MRCLLILLLLIFGLRGLAQKQVEFDVVGVKRTALVVEPVSKTNAAPVLLVFHGHFGTARFAYRRMDFHAAFPEAIVVYLQGLPTKTQNDLAGRGNGWQIMPGQSGDRDLIFTDSVLGYLQRYYKTDPQRVYAAGHSNGARFVNLLWAKRPEKFAAFISVAAQGGQMIKGAKPRSIWMSIGLQDKIVDAETQLQSVPIVKSNLGINSDGEQADAETRLYKGFGHTELIVQLREAGHEFPAADIPEMVEFLRRQRIE